MVNLHNVLDQNVCGGDSVVGLIWIEGSKGLDAPFVHWYAEYGVFSHST